MAGYYAMACNHQRSKVVLCSPIVNYGHMHFFSRYPLEKTKIWNLTNLLTINSWIAYLVTIITVLISLKVSCHVGQKLGLGTVTEEIALVPFR